MPVSQAQEAFTDLTHLCVDLQPPSTQEHAVGRGLDGALNQDGRPTTKES